MEDIQYNELLALARQVAGLRNELDLENVNTDTYNIFLFMVDQLTSTVFKQQGDRQDD